MRATNRLIGIAGAMLLALLIYVPVTLAAEPQAGDNHVVISLEGDITLPAGLQSDALVVVSGIATINGDAGVIVVIDGTANLVGANADSVLAIRSQVNIDAASTVRGDIATFESVVDQADPASVQGAIRDFSRDLGGLSSVISGLWAIVALGFAIAALVAGLALAAFGARQVRSAEAILSREPLNAFVAAFAGLVVIIILGVIAMITVIGIPLGFGILAFVLPALAFVGYLVAGIWIGNRIRERFAPGPVAARPYRAAIVGIGILGIASVLPVAGGIGALGSLIGGIAGLMGFGAVTLLLWRTLRSDAPSEARAPQQQVGAAATS